MKYQLVDKIKTIHTTKVFELMSKVNLKPLFLYFGIGHQIGLAMSKGQTDRVEELEKVETQMYENGILANSISELLAMLSKENLLCEFAAILLEEEGSNITDPDAWEDKHKEISKYLLFQPIEEVFELVGKFIENNQDLIASLKEFFLKEVKETAEDLPQ